MTQSLRERIRIAFFDIDDTIYSKATGRLSDSIEKAFAGLQKRGIIPAIATGRARYVFPKPLEEVIGRLGMQYFVTINGQLNLRGTEVVSDYPFAPDDLARVTQYFTGRGMPVVYSQREYMATVHMTERFEQALFPIMRDFRMDRPHVEGDAVYQIIIGYDEAQQASVEASGILDGGRFKTVRWHEDAVDFLAAAGSKVRGIQDVIASLGLTLDNVIVFGDSLNDIEMLSEAGFGVAMANGHPEVKQHADFEAPAQQEDGVYRALLELDLIDPA